MIYFIVLILLLACIYNYDFKKRSNGAMFAYVMMALIFVLIFGLRFRIGSDTVAYEGLYKNEPGLLDLANYSFRNTRFQPGYIIFQSIPRTFSSEFVYFQLFHALVVNAVVFWFFYKNTDNRFTGIFLYTIGISLNLNTEVLRETLAVCCFLMAWPAFKKGKWLIYYLWAVLAFTFHISAIILILIPLFVIPGIRQAFRLGFRTIFICIAIFAVLWVINKKFYGLIQMFSDDNNISDRAHAYEKSKDYGGMVINISGLIFNLVKYVLLPAFSFWFYKKRFGNEVEKKTMQRIEVLIVTGIYFSVGAFVLSILGRYNNYFCFFYYMVLASCFFKSLPLKKKKILRIQPAIWVFVLVIWTAIDVRPLFVANNTTHSVSRYALYYPYNSVLDPEYDSNREELLRYISHMY